MNLQTLGELASVVMLLGGCSRASYFVCRGTSHSLDDSAGTPTQVEATLKIDDERNRFDPEAGEDSGDKGYVEFTPVGGVPESAKITWINDSTVIFFNTSGQRLRFGGEFDRLTRNLTVRLDDNGWDMACRQTKPARV